MAKAKLKRVGSFLCFSAPVTDEDVGTVKRDKPSTKKRRDSSEADRSRGKSHRRSASKIIPSSSVNSNSSDWRDKSSRDSSRSTSKRIPEESSSSGELSGKDSDASILSSSSSSSCSSSASYLSHAAESLSVVTESTIRRTEKTVLPSSASRNDGYATGLVLVLVTLSVMVFCGRLGAIFWMATWLCLVPRRMAAKPPEADDVAVEVRKRRNYHEEELKKKRVVMEGFLQRNHVRNVN